MHITHEKGTQVNPTHHIARQLSIATGLVAMLGALLRGSGSGAPAAVSRSRAYRPLVLALSVTLSAIVILTAGVSPAFASVGAPIIELVKGSSSGSGVNAAFFSTRMSATAEVRVNELATKWRAEYSTSRSAVEHGSGTLADSGELAGNIGGGDEQVAFGSSRDGLIFSSGDGTRPVLGHLTPNTHYYARFVAENADGKAEAPFEFTTLPVAKPEIGTSSDEPFSEEVEAHRPQNLDFWGESPGPDSAAFKMLLETNGATTTYTFGLSRSSSGPVTDCANSGSITAAEEFTEREFHCIGLEPETTYYVHLLATNEKGTLEWARFPKGVSTNQGMVNSFTTPSAKPVVLAPTFRNITAESGLVDDSVRPHREETRWRFEAAPFVLGVLGVWAPVPGAAGTISRAEAEALPTEESELAVAGALVGLDPATMYDVRLFAENASGEAEYCSQACEPVSTATEAFSSFDTTGPPTATTFAVHSLQGESPRVIGAVDPDNTPTSGEQTVTIAGAPTGGTFTLTFKGQTTEPLAFDAPAHGLDGVEHALNNLPGEPASVGVRGADGGPYTIDFDGRDGEVEEPRIEGNASGLMPSGSIAVAVTDPGGVGYDTHYHFQYVGQKAFEAEGGFTGLEVRETPEVEVGAGVETKFGAADLSGLTAGETYRYRIVAASTYPGPAVDGAEQTLTVPAVPTVESAASCPNEAFRVGASARLPDCRAYEQITPTHKEGAREPFDYGLATGGGVLIAEGGDRVMLEAEATDWGTSPAAGQGPYFFSREEGKGWQMTAASPQPETGIDSTTSGLFSPNLEGFAFSSSFKTSEGSESKDVEYKAGPPGGPYVTAAAIPSGETGVGSAWVAASRDFSRLFLASEDHSLLGVSTGTKNGSDLYEYVDGELRQVNVTGSSGSTIGACGAHIVNGDEEAGTESSAHAVSANGLRVFFEAVPGKDCSEPKDLYMREDGEGTVDLGAYRFLGANAEGTEVLLEKRSGETREVLLDELESATLKTLFAVHSETTFAVSEDFSTIYFISDEHLTPQAPSAVPGNGSLVGDIYRYDIPSETLSFIDTGSRIRLEVSKVSPNGDDLYLEADALEGVPGGKGSAANQGGGLATNSQVYRYDSEESVLQCMSCSSSFDPEPKLTAVFGDIGGNGGILRSLTGYPRQQFASANGDYVFFDTPSALLPSDVDGEVAPEDEGNYNQRENSSTEFSVSSDVYEWRKPGIDGCAHVEGCLALITNGRGGFLNLFLGTDGSGRDALIYTGSQLVPGDDDTAGDVYDARIGGGAPPPAPRPVECEGDACSTPASPPNDATPSSFTFSGAGNALAPTPVGKPAAKSRKRRQKSKPKKGKPKGSRSKQGKAKRKRARGAGGRQGRKASRRRGMATKSSGRVK
jgi:hypothetical protein